MKRIAIFCDGTWNTPDKMEDGQRCQTNVVKMANALAPLSDDGTEQILYYDTGIGSEGNIFKRIYDGATGTGISKNILQAYRFLIKNYAPKDEIFLFGFSRGAFTVRSLAGLIRNSGILKPEYMDKMVRAYKIYRSRKAAFQPKEVESTLFRKTFAAEELTTIKFIGVWDTVGALGNPLVLNGILSRKNQFHDASLTRKIENAFHALAIDEKRKNFKATLWRQKADVKNQVLEQVWFTGVHSDIGGGYPPVESGLSDISLHWMLEKAQSFNLKFNAIDINTDPMAQKHKSYKGFYKFRGKNIRPLFSEESTKEALHPSVMERYNNEKNYRPQNLVDYLSQQKNH